MMMRSAPAASAHLAEIPVPAPAPRMGIPCSLLALHRSRHADRSVMLSPNLPAWVTRPRPEIYSNSPVAADYPETATAAVLTEEANGFRSARARTTENAIRV